MQEHSMKLRPGPFDVIRSGTKRIEMRLMDEKREAVRPGDMITFTNTDSGETLRVSVVFTERYPCFEDVYKAYPPEMLGYRPDEPCSPSDMSQYYSGEDVARYGVLAIGIALVSFSY